MRWTRCNNCYAKAENAKESFSLTRCGHTYCGRCIGQATRQCVICNAANVPAVRLQEPLDPGVAIYFTPLRETLQQLLAVSDFHDEQIRIVMKKFNEIETKYTYAKVMCRKFEIETAKMQQKYSSDRQEDKKRIRNLVNENIQLKLALDKAHGDWRYDNLASNPSSASSAPSHGHSCGKRYQPSDSKLSFFTPASTNAASVVSDISSVSGRNYRAALAEGERVFQVPSIQRVPRSARTRSLASAASTPINRTPGCLEAMISDFRITHTPNNNLSFI